MPPRVQDESTKRCATCRIVKHISEFYKALSGHISKRRSVQAVCKVCQKQYQKDWRVKNLFRHRGTQRRYNRRRRELHPDECRSRTLRSKYGVTFEEYKQLKELNGPYCAICGRECDLHLDHNHKNKVIRGFLCRYCNTGLGYFKGTIYLTPLETNESAFSMVRREVKGC